MWTARAWWTAAAGVRRAPHGTLLFGGGGSAVRACVRAWCAREWWWWGWGGVGGTYRGRPSPPHSSSPAAAPPGINRNRYIALMAAIALRESPGETIVTDSCTSNGLARFITALGGRHFRCGSRAARAPPPLVHPSRPALHSRCRASRRRPSC